MPRLVFTLIVALLVALPAMASEGRALLRPWDGTQPLDDLARQYGISLADLKEANPDLESRPLPSSLHIPAPPGGWPRYQVQPGETLWALARRFEVDMGALRQINGLAGDDLKAGQELLLPRAPMPTPPPRWLAVTLPDGRQGWVPGEAVVLPATSPLPREEVLLLARRLQGTPYRFGGATPDAMDCSGFVQEVYRMGGYRLPRLADQQFAATRPIAVEDLEPGDLVFFSTYLPGPSHVGIYLGQGRFLHASSSRGVTEDALDTEYFASRFLGGHRLPDWMPASEPDEPAPSAVR